MSSTRRVVIFVLIAYAFSWLFWVPDALIAQNLWDAPSFIRNLLAGPFNLGPWGPLFAALVTTAVFGGWAGVKSLLKRGLKVRLGKWWWWALLTFPVLIGGDHSATGPAVRALAAPGPLCVLQIDAHLDATDEVMGSRDTSSSPMRRAAEIPTVTRILQVGIRGARTSQATYREARARGNLVLTPDALRAHQGWATLLNALDACGRCYVTLDMDAFDPAFAPGVSSPEPGGFDYPEVRRLLREVAARTTVVGFDVMETNPLVDGSGATAYLAAVAALELLGAIFP